MQYAVNATIDIIVVVDAETPDEAETKAHRLIEEQVSYGSIEAMDDNAPSIEIGYIETMDAYDDLSGRVEQDGVCLN